MRYSKKYLHKALLFLAISGCSSAPATLEERFHKLKPEAQQAFIAIYPLHHPPERNRASIVSPNEPETWQKDDAPGYSIDIKHRTITHLWVKPSINNPIQQGNELNLTATLEYADGRKANATQDATWSVYPALGTMEGSTLTYGCAASDVVVSATFLDLRTGSTTLEFRKPIESLELDWDHSSRVAESGEFLLFKLVAHCKDGTSSDVTCQANWKSSSKGIDASGCGKVRVARMRDKSEFEVTASYGGLTVHRAFHTPLRR